MSKETAAWSHTQLQGPASHAPQSQNSNAVSAGMGNR